MLVGLLFAASYSLVVLAIAEAIYMYCSYAAVYIYPMAFFTKKVCRGLPP